jgi:hypothetical protein
VNAQTLTFVRWRAHTERGEILVDRIEWQPAGMPAPFTLDIPAFFDDALG